MAFRLMKGRPESGVAADRPDSAPWYRASMGGKGLGGEVVTRLRRDDDRIATFASYRAPSDWPGTGRGRTRRELFAADLLRKERVGGARLPAARARTPVNRLQITGGTGSMSAGFLIALCALAAVWKPHRN